MTEQALLDQFPELLSVPSEKREQLYRYFASAPDWVLEHCFFETIPAGTFFIREGEPVKTIYFVVDGLFKAIDYRIFGVEYTFAKFSKVYSMGGLEILMDFTTYRTSLQTIDDCKVIKLSHSAFDQWMQEDIEGLRYESKTMGEYLLSQNMLTREYLFLSGPERLAKVFIEKYENEAKNGLLEVYSTRQELSDETGFGIKTISRAIKSLCDDGYISKGKKCITIAQEQYDQLKDLLHTVIASDPNNIEA